MSGLLIPVEDIVLSNDTYRLARNGRYSLHRPLSPDAFGVVAHAEVSLDALDNRDVDSLIQLLGEKTEELQRMRAAVAKKE